MRIHKTKLTSIILIASLSLTLTACGGSEPGSAQSPQVTTEASGTTEWSEPGLKITESSTEKREQVDVEDPNKPIEGGGDVSIEPTSETTEEVTSTEEVTETTETETTAPSGAYTYTVYGDITLTMDINIDDYIEANIHGDEFFYLYRLASDLGWLERGEHKVTEDMSEEEKGASWWTYSNGKCRTLMQFAEENPADFQSGPITYIGISFVKQDSTKKYYDDKSINHKEISIDFSPAEYDPNNSYCIAWTDVRVTRDDIVILAYTLWFMKDHCGEALEFCQSFGPHYIQSDVATFNNINLP